VRIVRIGELPLDDVAGGRVARTGGVGDVQAEHALAAAAEAAHQISAPDVGRQLDVLHRQLPVHVVAVLVVLHRQVVEILHHRRRHVGEDLVAIAGRERVQHAVVGADVDHRCAVRVGSNERQVGGAADAGRRLADVGGTRVDDVAEDGRDAPPELLGANPFLRVVAAQVVHPLQAAVIDGS
jgi:hypothetical protein